MSLYTLVLPLLVLVSITSASHFWGGTISFTPKGRNPDGSYRVDFRYKHTFDSCSQSLYWGTCRSGQCGSQTNLELGIIDDSNGRYSYQYNWCQKEGVMTRSLWSDRPFQLTANSCCWVSLRNSIVYWDLPILVDLGVRSDTNEPNSSPHATMISFVRVPQNCPRAYNFIGCDPDGDKFRCGTSRSLPSGFHLDQNTCNLHYTAWGSTGYYGFELYVEDFPNQHISLTYSDGTQSIRGPLHAGRRRRAPWGGWYNQTSTPPISTPLATNHYTPWLSSTTSTPSTTTTTTNPTTPWWGGWFQTTIAPTTTASPTTPWWGWYQTQRITTAPTTTASPTTPWWGWYQTQRITTAPTTTASPTTPWWGWYQTQRITTAPTTTASPTTPWWGWYQTQRITTAPTTTASPTTPLWWWYQTQRITSAPTPRTTTTTTTSPPATSNPWSHYGTPLSRLPLQFVVLVDVPAPSCSEGVYLPKFLHPTPNNRERLHAAINQELEIRINATASVSVVRDLIISGPLNITKDRTTSGEFVLRWTPRTDDLGQHFPICFIAESKLGANFYQSEMRCVVVEVEHHQFAPEANVICSENFMAIELETSISESITLHVDHLRLNDPSCTLYSNGTHVFANMSLNTCGTTMEEDDDSLFFKNEIVSFDNQNDVITRINQVEFQFFCKYPKKSSVTLEFDTHRGPYVFIQKGFGTFSYQFEFFRSSQFQYRRDPKSYPLEYGLGERMYMQIEGISSVNNTELFVESCKASPSDDPQAQTSYSIIENGCKKDETVQFYSNHDNKVQFGMKAFKFIGWHDQVFITCSVILCEAGNPNTRCSQGCTNATASPAVHHHHRREAPIQTTSHYVSQGPVRLSRSADIRDAPSTVINNGLNMNLVVIAGCLLIVSAMVCGAVIYTKRPKIAYQPLPTSDS
ncbi:uncharacterized protein LOC143126005 [Alosa pseudoharengus]|uniref:uncharacterized protein LOC143126005 n=1 Tax=Alosa pseudoharengus TaxID=34774 RepID=UPI003F88EC10